MSDARTRELERLAAEGDLAAEAELLVARMRAGTIARERIELLAYCGHPVAEQMAEVQPAPDPLSWCGVSAGGGCRPQRAPRTSASTRFGNGCSTALM